MFSYFDGGIKDTERSSFLDLTSLINKIKSNPNAEKIKEIRSLRNEGDNSYKSLKSELPYITPNCMVNKRNLSEDHFEKNFISFSQFIYFDLDVPNAEEYKIYFTQKYGHLASMICLSSSGGGISVLFKIKNKITKDNFEDIWLAICNTILKDEEIDIICKDIGRAMFISYDESVFYNYDNEIQVELEDSISKTFEKEGKQCKSYIDSVNTLISPFFIYSIDQVLDKLITSTQVEVINPIFDYKPVEYHKFFIPKVIHDGTKHAYYTSMIHSLVHLNPNLERDYIFSYLHYINNNFAKPKMEMREFVRLFNMVYNGIKNKGNTTVKTKTKSVHLNLDCNLTKKEKISVANTLNGTVRKNKSIQKVIDAKIELERRGQKITQKSISQISGLSPKTVRTHLNSSHIDMKEMVQMINDSME